MKISILIPALNEAHNLSALLPMLQSARAAGHEVIVCDGGSVDETVTLARPLADWVVSAPRGRACQMNAAARRASGQVLLFLHADTRPPRDFIATVQHHLSTGTRLWGRFDVRLESPRVLLKVVQTLMNWRSRWTGIATGDQAIFVRRDTFERVGGYPDIALMEDIALSKRLKRLSPPVTLRACVATSARRWEQQGAWRTIFMMWRLRLAYWLGADPAELAARYDGPRH